MPGVEREPIPTQISLKPGAEVRGVRNRRDANVAEIAGAVSGGNVHAAAKRDREVGEITAHARLVGISAMRCSESIRILIVEGDVTVDKVADRLNPRPTRLRAAKIRPCEI